MGYGALSAADYFDSPGFTANPKVYVFKWGRNGWQASAQSYTGTKPLGSFPVTPGTFTLSNTFLSVANSCTGSTPDSELVRCVGFAVIAGASSGQASWAAGSDALYRPIDLRDTVPSGGYIYDNSSASYSFQIPFQSLFSSAGSYANLQKLDQTFSGTSKYVFYNRTQVTALMAGMGARMLGYDAVGMRFGQPTWNNTTVEKDTGSSVGTLMTGQSTGTLYAGTISTLHTTNTGLALAPTISSGPSAGSITNSTTTITWSTNYPTTSMVKYSTISGGPYTTSNDTVLNTSHSVALTGLTTGTTYYYKAISYDCVANKVESSEGSFTTL